MLTLAAITIALAGLAGVALTALTLPGVWLVLALAVGWQFACDPAPMSWTTIGVAAGLALVGEIVEFVASAVGSSRAGGGKGAAAGSIIGALVGAVVGSFVVPIVGTIVGAVAGAGLGAAAAERGVREVSWGQTWRVGAGAAAGRAVAMVAKLGVACAVAIVLVVGALR
ncbi:MAG: DUF456 family protein [Phycisphaerae bacterium]|nr:DUF456 family protein [Phycisphaerae bacterium]